MKTISNYSLKALILVVFIFTLAGCNSEKNQRHDYRSAGRWLDFGIA